MQPRRKKQNSTTRAEDSTSVKIVKPLLQSTLITQVGSVSVGLCQEN